MTDNELRLKILDYEVNASRWWTGWMSTDWLQKVAGSYFAWKVKRKFRAYQIGMAIRAEMERKERFFGRCE